MLLEKEDVEQEKGHMLVREPQENHLVEKEKTFLESLSLSNLSLSNLSLSSLSSLLVFGLWLEVMFVVVGIVGFVVVFVLIIDFGMNQRLIKRLRIKMMFGVGEKEEGSVF